MMEKLEVDKFAVKNAVTTSGLPYEEFRTFLMHTIWLTESNSLSRWFEWHMTVRTYTVITTGKTPRASVYPYEITGPPCKDCIMSITHSGSMIFYEERDRTAADFPNTSPMVYLKDCDWNTPRNDLAFQSLAGGICFSISLNDKASLRKFKLEKLSFGYRGSDGITRAIDHKYLYDETGTKQVVSNTMDYVKWDQTTKKLNIRLKILVLGQVDRLQYQAQIRLCELETPYVANSCKIVKAGVAGTDATDLKFNRLRQRILEGHEPSRLRYLADKDKAVVQQYTSESTFTGKSDGVLPGGGSTTKKEESSPVGAIVGGVVVVGALATVGYMWKTGSGCFNKGASPNTNVNANPTSGPNSNMQPAV